MRPEARVIAAAAPAPAGAAKLALSRLRALLKKAGRKRGAGAGAQRLREAFRQQQTRQLPLAGQAMGRQGTALPRQLGAARASAGELEQAATESLDQHPGPGIITSLPGTGALAGARVLAGTGDDRSRFQDARGPRAYAGSAPSPAPAARPGPSRTARAKDNRLAAAGRTAASAALTASPGARARHDRRRDRGDRHRAQRNPFNRLPGRPRHRLQTGQHYHEATAFPNQPATKAAARHGNPHELPDNSTAPEVSVASPREDATKNGRRFAPRAVARSRPCGCCEQALRKPQRRALWLG